MPAPYPTRLFHITAIANLPAIFAAGALLSKNVCESLARGVEVLEQAGAKVLAGGKPADAAGFRHTNTLLRATAKQFIAAPHVLQTECFGNASLAVTAGATWRSLPRQALTTRSRTFRLLRGLPLRVPWPPRRHREGGSVVRIRIGLARGKSGSTVLAEMLQARAADGAWASAALRRLFNTCWTIMSTFWVVQ